MCSIYDELEYKLLSSFITDKTLPSNLSKNKRDSLRRKAKGFVLKSDGLLYFRYKKKGTDLKVSKILELINRIKWPLCGDRI